MAYFHFFVLPFPVDEAYEDGVTCSECGAHLAQEAYFDGVANFHCETCWNPLIERAMAEARTYAEENCRITQPLPKYDSNFEFRCTPEEYDTGAKESYSPNAYMSHCRHNCTNYDSLIEPLAKEYEFDRVIYLAINAQIEELLQEAIDVLDCEEDEEDNEMEAEIIQGSK